jgi:putative nucleotidyltransferase with HDIG domain
MPTVTPKATLQDVTRAIDSLPTLPEITSFVLEMLEDPASSSQDVTNVLVRDPSLSGQILKLVNSAYYGLPQKVSDLTRAIALLGYGRIKNLVLSLSLIRVFRTMSKRSKEDFQRFWLHSSVVAGLMKRLALRMGRAEPEQAFVAGLLHDVGKLILLGYAPKEHEAIVKLAQQRQAGFAELEGEVLATTHAEIGGWAARAWNLPRETVETVEWHHRSASWELGVLPAMLYFADYAARVKGVTCAGTFGAMTFAEKAWEVLGLPQEDYFEMMTAVESEQAIGDMILQVAGVAATGSGV